MCDRYVLQELGHDSLVDLAIHQAARLERLTHELEDARNQAIYWERQALPAGPFQKTPGACQDASAYHWGPGAGEALAGALLGTGRAPCLVQPSTLMEPGAFPGDPSTPGGAPARPDTPHSAKQSQEESHDHHA